MLCVATTNVAAERPRSPLSYAKPAQKQQAPKKHEPYVPVGSLQELLDFDSIPRAKPWRTYRASSGLVDRAEDYGNFVREEPRGHFVLMDVEGAGCIDRFWCVYRKGRPQEVKFDLLVYLDGRTEPVIDIDLNDLFDGRRKPFTAPLVGRCGFEDRQASFSYVPIGFRRSCKVVAVPREPEKLGWRDRDGRKRSHFIFFYQMDYRLCAPEVPVRPFQWNLDDQQARALMAVQARWRGAGKSPEPPKPNDKRQAAQIELGGKQEAVLLDHAGAGTLREMRLKITAGDNSPGLRMRLAESLWLDMTWDGAASAQVSAPLSTFFVAPDSAIDVRGLPLGCVDGEYYCYLPMPFRRHAKVAVRLIEPVGEKVTVESQFRWDPALPPPDHGLFHARRYGLSNAAKGRNLTLLDTRGRGHVVGVLADRCGDVESDDSWFIDGETRPSIVGTGTEDFFNFAWGLGDLQALPMHGVRVPFGPPEKRGQRTDTGVCYRFHLPAGYPFHKSLRLTWEHGSGNHDTRGRYSGITYYYLLADEKQSSPGAEVSRETTYSNPIVRGDWSDPGVIRVGDDYYSVCSTNNWQPGIPIIHSKNLVHWRYIGHAFRSKPDLQTGVSSGGVYGLEMGYNPPTKMFLIYAPLANRELYVYYSQRPEGPFQEKHLGKLGIDPGFFADTDGRLYLVMYKGEIYELARDGLSVKRLVTKIDTSRYKFFEGPDIFKRNDWYYILYSDGGTRPHQPSTISVLRSRRIEGPWEEDPGNPVLFATDDGSPLQGPAHGTLIETQNGEWFVTFHAHELSHYSLGRPMCLAPIEWTDDGWWRPCRGKAPPQRAKAPNLPACDYALAQSDEFDSTRLGQQWMFHCRPPEAGGGWSLTERPGWLRIEPRPGKPIESEVLPAVFLQRMIDKQLRLTTRVDFDASASGHAAGLCMYHDPGMNFWLATTHCDGKKTIEVGKTNDGKRTSLWTVENKIGAEVHLRIDVDGEETATFYYGPDGKQWTRLGESIYFGDSWQDLRNGRGGDPDLGWIGIKKRNAWSAATFGLFAVRGADAVLTPADFDFLRVSTPGND